MRVRCELSRRPPRVGSFGRKPSEDLIWTNPGFCWSPRGATTDYEIANIRGGLEAGIHYLENYDEFMGSHTITDSDWAALPYAGLRVEADITVWDAAGLNLGVWSSLRADLTTFEQQILVHKGFWSEGLQMQAYQAGGLQLAGGVKTGIRF